MYLALPSIHNRLGLSLYWCDIAAAAVIFRYVIWDRSKRGFPVLDRWYVGLGLAFAVGILGTIVRFGHFLEPGYLTMRSVLALAPLLVMPRALQDEDTFDQIFKAAVAAGLFIGLLAVLQSWSTELALQTESLLYSGYGDSAARVHRYNQVVYGGQLRVFGNQGASTAFGGAAALTAVFLVVLGRTRTERRWITAAIGSCVLAAALTYSRHSMLALVVFVAMLALMRPSRVLSGVVVLGLVIGLVAIFTSLDLWIERLARGGLEDRNVQSRLIRGPLELVARVDGDPSVLLYGAGLGMAWFLSEYQLAEARFGFASNTFLLYLFYCGVPAFLAYLAFFAHTSLHALSTGAKHRGILFASVFAAALVIASDNYGFFKYSVPFLWSTIAALTFATPRVTQASHARTAGLPTLTPGLTRASR